MVRNNIELIFNKSELGASIRGASLGIDALILAALGKGSTFFKHIPSTRINDKNDLLSESSTHKRAKYIDGLVAVYQEICTTVGNVLLSNHFPFIISGDHASAGGTVAGIKKTYPKARLGIIWIDAHADLHSPYTSPSGNVHGMSLATILNEDNLQSDSHNVAEDTIEQWRKLKSTGGIVPKASPEDIVYIGLRDTEKEEDYLIKKYCITNYAPCHIREKTISVMIKEIKEQKLASCDIIYISFDVDSLDSKFVSSGTGTPVENGLLEHEVKEILREFMRWDKVVCFEMTEINPLLDNKGNKMAETALEIMEYALS